jgi:3-hydroxyacyl-CoA dehydrogenase
MKKTHQSGAPVSQSNVFHPEDFVSAHIFSPISMLIVVEIANKKQATIGLNFGATPCVSI